MKQSFGGNEPGHHPVINGMAGGTATMAHDAIVTPLDVVKQRLQMRNSAYRGPLHCIRTVFAQEGLRAFYASYPTTVAMNVPFQAVHFAAYESFKILFTKEGEEHGIFEDFAAGGAAGALAGCVSTPFDVVKVRSRLGRGTCMRGLASRPSLTVLLLRSFSFLFFCPDPIANAGCGTRRTVSHTHARNAQLALHRLRVGDTIRH